MVSSITYVSVPSNLESVPSLTLRTHPQFPVHRPLLSKTSKRSPDDYEPLPSLLPLPQLLLQPTAQQIRRIRSCLRHLSERVHSVWIWWDWLSVESSVDQCSFKVVHCVRGQFGLTLDLLVRTHEIKPIIREFVRYKNTNRNCAHTSVVKHRMPENENRQGT